jgi:hypothetical protein
VVRPAADRQLHAQDLVDLAAAGKHGAFLSAQQKIVANAVVDYYWQQLILASFVDLSDPDTIAGVQALESLGLIPAGRAAEILA